MKLKGLNAFFGNSKVLLIAFILVFATKIFGFFEMHSSVNNFELMLLSLEFIMMAIMVLGLFISYVFHESNIQKSLLSNIYLLQIIHLIIPLFTINEKVETLNMLIVFLSVIQEILWVVSYIVHLVMLSDKAGKKGNIRINQIIFLLILLIEVIFTYNILNTTSNFINAIYANTLMTLFLIVCIDTKIGIYKRTRLELREKGKWDDKTKAKTKEIFNLF